MSTAMTPPVPVPGGADRAEREPMPAPLRSTALRVGMQITLLAPFAAAASFVLATHSEIGLGPYAPLFVALAVAAALATLLPWDQLFRSVWGMRVLYAWAGADLILITIGILATDGPPGSLLLVYALTTVFFGVVFPPRAQLVFVVFTLACYVVAMHESGFDPLPLIVLGTLGFLAHYLSRELRRQMSAHRAARVDAERRWALVSAVSTAARDMTTTDPHRVLQAVVDAIVSLGFGTARIYIKVDPDRFDVVLPDGVRRDFPEGIGSLPDEIRTQVLQRARPVQLGTATSGAETTQTLRAIGVEALVAQPILVNDRPGAVLVVGTAADSFTKHDVEVFRMLGAQATMALDNAHRFEDQRRTVERLSELDKLKTDFLSTVSHELRTPITVIKGMGRTLEQQWDVVEDDVRRELVTRLNANSVALDSIIDQLLDFSRMEAGRLDARLEDVDAGEVVTRVAARLSALFASLDLRIEVQGGLIVRGDPLLLERVVENLLSNAAKYTPAGSWVHVSANRDGEQTVVAVTDGGPGIPRHEIRNLGQRFFRGGEAHTRETRGTGLGLALVREILVLHGTELEIQSEVGVGSRFSFRLPGDTSALAASSGEASASAVGTSLASQARQLSFDDLLLSTIAARAAAPDEATVEAPEQPQSRTSKLGAAAVATVVTATSSLAVTGALPDHAQDVVAAALTSIGVSSSLADGSERAWPPRPASPREDALSGRDQSGSGGERTGGGDGGGTSTGGSAGGSTGGTASSGGSSGGGGSGGGGSGGGGSGGGGSAGGGSAGGGSGGGGSGAGGSGAGGSGGPGGSGDAPGQTGDAGHSGDAPGQNKDGGRNGGNGPRGGKGSTKRPLRPSTSSPTSR